MNTTFQCMYYGFMVDNREKNYRTLEGPTYAQMVSAIYISVVKCSKTHEYVMQVILKITAACVLNFNLESKLTENNYFSRIHKQK